MKLDSIKKVVVHANCPDGMASAILLHHALPDAEIVFAIHNTPEYLNMPAEPGMLFCDIFPPKDRIKEFVDAGTKVLDHHKGFKEFVDLFGENAVFAHEKKEPGVSGASLAFREVWLPTFEKSYDTDSNLIVGARFFAALAGIRDTWQTQDRLWIKGCYQAAVLTFFDWDYWKKRVEVEEPNFLFQEEMKIGQMLFEQRLARAKRIAKKILRYEAGDAKIAIFMDPDRLTSDVAEALKGEVDMVIGFRYTSEDGMPVLVTSVRTYGDIDAAEFASCFKGGGGHSTSAGFSRHIASEDLNPFTYLLDFFQDFMTYGSDFLKRKLDYKLESNLSSYQFSFYDAKKLEDSMHKEESNVNLDEN